MRISAQRGRIRIKASDVTWFTSLRGTGYLMGHFFQVIFLEARKISINVRSGFQNSKAFFKSEVYSRWDQKKKIKNVAHKQETSRLKCVLVSKWVCFNGNGMLTHGCFSPLWIFEIFFFFILQDKNAWCAVIGIVDVAAMFHVAPGTAPVLAVATGPASTTGCANNTTLCKKRTLNYR